MTDNEKFEYWADYAKADLDTAEAMVKSKRWLYVAFMCQQAVEKIVKGLYGLYCGFDKIPYVHNISVLLKAYEAELSEPISAEYYDFFDLLTGYYLNNRYPEYKERVNERMKKGDSVEVFNKTKEVFAWLLTMKP